MTALGRDQRAGPTTRRSHVGRRTSAQLQETRSVLLGYTSQLAAEAAAARR